VIEERAFCFFDARENGGYTFESCWRQAKKIWTWTCCIVGGILVVLWDIAVHLVLVAFERVFSTLVGYNEVLGDSCCSRCIFWCIS
jgi:hypothetical protein